MVLQRLVRQIVIVQMDVAFDTVPHLPRTVIVVDIDLVFFQQIGILWTRKMAALVTVDNSRLTPRQRPFHGLEYEPDFKALVQLPVDDIAGIPIHNGVQVHPAVLHPDIRDVHRPHLIRLCDGQLPKEIRIYPVLQIALAQVRAGIDGHEPHFPYVAPYGVLVDPISFPIHDDGNLPVAQERMLRVQLINPVLEANFLRGGRDRLVVKAGTIQAEQIGFHADRVFKAIPFQQIDALLTRQVKGQIFF